MRILTVGLALLMISLAGCAGGDEPVAGIDEPTPADDADQNETLAPVNETVQNLVPVLNVTVDTLNGTAPLLVQINITVEDDSENLTWAFLVDGNETRNGTGFPAAFNHTFDVGSWNVTVVATDGEHSVNQSFLIDVALGGLPPIEPQHYEGETTASVGACGHSMTTLVGAGIYDSYPAGHPLENVEWLKFDIEPRTIGYEYTMTRSQTVPIIWGATFNFYDADGESLESMSARNDTTGTVPEGAAFAVLWPCGPGPIGFTYDGGLLL